MSPAPPSPSQKFLTSVHKTSQKLDNFCEDTAEISLAIRGQKSPSLRMRVSLLPTKRSSQGRRWNSVGWFVKLGAATAKYESKCHSLRRLLETVCAGGRHAATLVVVGGKMRALDDVRPLTISDKRSRHDTSSTWPSLSTPQPLKSTTTTTPYHQYSVHLAVLGHKQNWVQWHTEGEGVVGVRTPTGNPQKFSSADVTITLCK